MKALSIQQPFASLVVHGLKRYETRSWPTSYRGPLAIHASRIVRMAQRERCWRPPIRGLLAQAGIAPSDLPLRCLVGVVRVVDCVPAPDLIDELDARERELGDWRDGRHAWLLADAVPLAVPVPWPGQLSLFELPVDVTTLLYERA
jgi:hypothetical protein